MSDLSLRMRCVVIKSHVICELLALVILGQEALPILKDQFEIGQQLNQPKLIKPALCLEKCIELLSRCLHDIQEDNFQGTD